MGRIFGIVVRCGCTVGKKKVQFISAADSVAVRAIETIAVWNFWSVS